MTNFNKIVSSCFLLALLGLGGQASAFENVTVRLDMPQTGHPTKKAVRINIDHYGFQEDVLSEESRLSPIHQDIVNWVSPLGEVVDSPESGVNLKSIRLDIDAIKRHIPEIEDPRSANPKYRNIFDLADLFSSIEGLGDLESVPRDKRSAHVELLGPYLQDIKTFSLCVILDYKANVEQTIKVPREIAMLSKQLCGKKRLLSDRLDLAFTKTSNNVDYYDKDFHGKFTDFMRGQNHLIFHNFSSWLCPATRDDMTNYAKAGWIASYQPLQPLENRNKCIDYLNGNVFKDMSSVLEKSIARLDVDANITDFHRDFLLEVVKLHEEVIEIENATIKQMVLDSIRNGIDGNGLLLSHKVIVEDLNIEAYESLLQSGEEYAAEEYLAAIFSSKRNGEKSPVKRAIEGKTAKAQVASIAKLKGAVLQECDLDQFDPNCMFGGIISIDSASFDVNFVWEQETVWNGYYLK